MKKYLIKSLLCLSFFSLIFSYFSKNKNVYSAPVTSLKNQLNSAQLSYFARLASGNTAGDSVIIVNTAGTTLSTNNYNLDIGDTVFIGTGTTFAYTVRGLSDTNAISLSGTLGAGIIAAGTPVIVPRYSTHTISFAPQSYDSTEVWQVLIRANGTTTATDGIPDADGFDRAGLVAGDITCPWGGAASVGSTAISAINYTLISCTVVTPHTYGDGSTGTIVIGGTHQLMNPAPASGHTVGQANSTADTYMFYLRELNGTTLMTTNSGRIALTESVRITATVDPTITFSVGNSGVTTSTARCGNVLGAGAANTTGAAVNFGSLNLTSANNLAQFIQCTTNAPNGYVVQAFQSDRLTMVGSGVTIPDTVCPSGTACTTTSPQAWTVFTNSGFGYSMEVGNATGATLGIPVSGQYKPFGIGYANAQPVLYRTTTPSNIDSAYMCYRITVGNFQPAGTYQNEINYIATATF